MACHIDYLPDEILEYILNLIPPYKDLKECMLVCKRWSHAVKHVQEHRQAYFQRSVSLGLLLWKYLPEPEPSRTAIVGKRHSHSACTYENSMYIFGGCTKTSTTFNDLWKFDLDTRKWERPMPMGSYPSPKACATMVYHNKSFILFGGWAHPSAYPPYQTKKLFDELHIYCVITNKWTAVETLEGPPPTSGHSASVHGNNMIVFGGVSDYFNTSNDVWCFNLTTHTWHKQATSEPKPHPRYGQSQLALDDNNLLILGGCTAHNVGMDDAWLLTMKGPSWLWTKINMLKKDYAPERIWCHQACKVGDHIIILSERKQTNQPVPGSSITDKVPCRGPTGLAIADVRQRLPEERLQPKIDRDENVNGRRGRFMVPRRPVQLSTGGMAPSSGPGVDVPVDRKWHGVMAAFNQDQRANTNRLKLLEDYRQGKMGALRNRGLLQKRKVNRLAIFVLNIANVLTEERSSTWIEHNFNEHTGPEERILYSLVLGKGELIFFGGIRKYTLPQGQNDVEGSEVYNDIHFINPPRYAI